MALALLLNDSSVGSAPVQTTRTCRVEQVRRYADKLAELPASIQMDLKRLIPELVDRNGGFQADDVSRSSPALSKHRFAGALAVGRAWYVWYEHGGMYHQHVIKFVARTADEETAGKFQYWPYGNLIGPPCAATRALIDGVGASGADHF